MPNGTRNNYASAGIFPANKKILLEIDYSVKIYEYPKSKAKCGINLFLPLLPKFCFMNQLYFGDNLDILKQLHRQHPEGFIDLIYIDPPFNSKRNYNVLFESLDMADTKAQKEAFADTWSNVRTWIP